MRWPWVLDPVRIAPWGTAMRPHLFEKEVTVTLSAPWQPKAEVRYTNDGTEPGPHSMKYEKPLKVEATTRLRAAAFEDGKRVCLESQGVFHKLIDMPPSPQVHLIEPDAGAGRRPRPHVCRPGAIRRPQWTAAEGQEQRGTSPAASRSKVREGVGRACDEPDDLRAQAGV